MVVQYGQREMAAAGMMPYPITLTRPAERVTDEASPVTVLAPNDPLLTTPNRITDADLRGWVQERAMYMPSTIDPHYQTVIAMNDPGEPPNPGGILARGGGTRQLHLHDARAVPAASRRRSRCGAPVRESARPSDHAAHGRGARGVAVIVRSARSRARRCVALAACGGDGRTVLTVYSPHGKDLLEYYEAGIREGASRRGRAVGGHGLAGSARPPARREGESAGRRLVRRAGRGLRARGE